MHETTFLLREPGPARERFFTRFAVIYFFLFFAVLERKEFRCSHLERRLFTQIDLSVAAGIRGRVAI